MNEICIMKNTIQPYAWGSHTAIADLLGQKSPSERPQAELWMGAHPKAPSLIRFQGSWQALNTLIEQHPVELLGRGVVERFGSSLPFLFKVLAAANPLSIQAHPDAIQARDGFQRENSTGVALDAPNRNYKDDQHKPECLCALTPFWGLCGFRPIAEISTLLDRVWPARHEDAFTGLKKDGIKPFFKYLMTLAEKERRSLVGQIVRFAGKIESTDAAVSKWICRLHDVYGTDIGVLSPLLLNLIHMSPGQAIYLPAGQLHAYLDGVGIELMANSDNVLRGGLTPKHIDTPELLRIGQFDAYQPEISEGEPDGAAERVYPSQVNEFILSVIQTSQGVSFTSRQASGAPEILLCIEGKAILNWQGGKGPLDLPKGNSAFIPAGIQSYSAKGNATLYRARVNL